MSPRLALLLAPWLPLVALACAGGPEATTPTQGCSERPPGLERDACTHRLVMALGAQEVEEAIRLSRTIRDPVVLGAAVSGWVRAHGRSVDQGRGRTLCALLGPQEEAMCLRRLVSAHLQR